MRHNRTLALLLAMLLATAGCLNSCGSTETESEMTPETTLQTETETEDPHLDDLPETMDLGGRIMRFLAQTEVYASNEILVEELNGEIINDAVFNRNSNLCQRLNVSIEQDLTTTGGYDAATRRLSDLVMAGSDDFDLFCSNSGNTSAVATTGVLTELTGLTYLDLSKEYWSQGFNETATIGHKQYFCTGPMALGFYRYLMVELFNKSMFDRYEIEYPYETVLAGEWTMEAQNVLAEQFYVDTNGDGSRDAEDTYGFYTRANNDTSINDGYWASLDLRTITKDENDAYVYDIDEENFVNGLDKLFMLMKGSGSYTEAENDDAIYKHFAQGKTAMINARLFKVEDEVLRNMEDEYGVLPLPKADATQESYYSLAQDQFLVYGIPLSVAQDGLEDIGIFLEAYASESYLVVRPAYYETALTVKYMNDIESSAMLDIVANNMYIDPAILYIGTFNFNVITLRGILKSGENTIASKIASSQKAMTTSVEKLNEFYMGE